MSVTVEMNLNEMENVSGGTFTPNTYSKEMYHAVGISTSYHFIDSDEFRFMGQPITYERANEIVQIARMVKDVMNTGSRGNDVVGYSENAFKRGFNSQLKLKYGITWDGKTGYDF